MTANRRHIAPELKKKMVELAIKHKHAEIARRLGVDRKTVSRIVNLAMQTGEVVQKPARSPEIKSVPNDMDIAVSARTPATPCTPLPPPFNRGANGKSISPHVGQDARIAPAVTEQDNEARIRHIVASRVGRVLRAGHPSRRITRRTAGRTGRSEL
ncbi:hypothetical protein FIBSPDRAFT_1046184 [Athelia psychrophila]|uniref:Uncharacterized protein n=1 Tax=Athelia psychrophila TaxID=1759441 RepID=A0A166H5E0_9AGAM|nr:hypothetical protein FIBSPDRAFT_1046184 [Fibularhizoctonia sp. CBS 109695]